jgi:hypothetical protein
VDKVIIEIVNKIRIIIFYPKFQFSQSLRTKTILSDKFKSLDSQTTVHLIIGDRNKGVRVEKW